MINTDRAESVVSRSSKKKKNRKKRAVQWTRYVENLKTTIDCMYEMCRSEQSVAGCREAILYLQSASNDFKSLIETINVEKEWESREPADEKEKRPSVAWEVRKSMCSPNPVTIKDKPLLPISSMIAEAVKNASEAQNNEDNSKNKTLTYARITAAAAVAAVAVSQPEEGWQVVSSRRRKSASSTTVSEFDREMSIEKEKEPVGEEPNVYERLSSTSYKRGPGSTSRALTCPRSAMDLPQTRASMAKMAYSRQLLWEKNQQALVEKLRAKQKKEKTRSSSQCGFTFADPQAVRKSVEAFNQQKSSRKGKDNAGGSQCSNSELQSINEHPTSENSEDVPADPTPSSSISHPPRSTKSATGSLFGYVQAPDELEKDDEWREMTEEEESLALEENSLNLEIKQAESMSIDAELERQVDAEAETLEKAEKKRKKEKQRVKEKEKEKTMEDFIKAFEEIRYQAWAELMEEESMQNVHEPGTPVEKHEKMSSPSRRRCQKDDDDFGRRHELKQKNAEMLRAQLQEAKSLKLKELTSRVEEIRAKQEALKERKRLHLEARMKRAAENREKNINEVIQRAKDDDQRVVEVKCIATLQEDHKRCDLMHLADERARKQEDRKREMEEARRAKAAEKELKNRQKRPEVVIPFSEVTHHKDMLTFLNSLCDPEHEASELLHIFPSPIQTTPRECTLCPSVVVRSDLEAAAHLVCSKEHLEQAKLMTSGSLVDELKRHFYGMFKEITLPEETDKKNEEEEKMMKARGILETVQLADPIPGPVSSPRNRTKYVREFNLSLERLSRTTGPLDEKCLESLEKSLAELLSAVETDMKNQESHSAVNLDQFCSINGPQKVMNLLLEWTSRGASLRLCIRLCHAFCTFLKDPRVAYSVIFKPELLRVVDRIVSLLATSSSSDPALAALLDVLTAVIKSVNSRMERRRSEKKHQKFKELAAFDDKAIEAIGAVGVVLQSSISTAELREAIEKSRGAVLCTRLVGLAEQIAHRGNSSLLKQYFDVILNLTYSKFVENRGKKQDVTPFSLFCQNKTILKMCLSENVYVLMLAVMLEGHLSSCCESLKNSNSSEVERAPGALTKSEEQYIKAAGFLTTLVESMETWQKRCLMISWTSDTSCLQMLRDIPIRLLATGNHADGVVFTIQRILDRFPNSERAEMMGDTSGDLFFNSSVFPGRKYDF